MLLVCDIGNTHLHLGIYDGERPVALRQLPGEQVEDMDTIWDAIAREAAPCDDGSTPDLAIDACVLCSVSPKIRIPFSHWFGRRFGRRPDVVGETIPYPMPVHVDDLREVGPDRVVNAYAAWRLLGRGPIVVCDFGTAITLDVVSASGAYIGGVIAPGVQTAARALSSQTALLPYVRVKRVERAIGHNTMDAIQGGLYYGMLGMVDAMCRQVAADLAPAVPAFLATGGDAPLFAEASMFLEAVEPTLTLEGLRKIWEARGAGA